MALGLGAPPHAHGNESEAFFALEGTVRVLVGDIDRVLHPGDFAYIPRNMRHKFMIESASARFLCIMTPGGFERFFFALGRGTEDAYAPNAGELGPFPTEQEFGEIAPHYNLRLIEDW